MRKCVHQKVHKVKQLLTQRQMLKQLFLQECDIPFEPRSSSGEACVSPT